VPPPKHFVFTTHASKRSRERHITEEIFTQLITGRHSRKQQYRGSNGGWVYLYTGTIDGKELKIAAEIYKDTCYFVTGYWTQ